MNKNAKQRADKQSIRQPKEGASAFELAFYRICKDNPHVAKVAGAKPDEMERRLFEPADRAP